VVLLEAIQKQKRATIEAVFAWKEGFERIMDRIRLDAIAGVVRHNTREIRNNGEGIQRNTEELGRHAEELRRIATMLESKSDHAALIAQKRVAALEKHVGL
jgi:hypothetical protein